MDVVQYLADQIGARPAGGPAEPEMLDFLEQRLLAAGLEVHRQTFAFRAWEASGEWSLSIEEKGAVTRLDAVPLPYTNPESSNDLYGRLEWEGEWPLIPGRVVCPRFVIRDEQQDVVAAIIGSPSGTARPLPNPNPLLALPTVVVSAEDAVYLRALIGANGDRTAVGINGGDISEGLRRSTNLVAEPPGGTPWLTVTAHYDCVPGSPGANDNATGVSLLTRIARRLDARDGVRFVLFGAEEPFIAGSRAYVASPSSSGALASCRACLNLDMVAVGERFAVRCVTNSSWARAFERLPSQSAAGVPIVRTDLYAASDHWAFHEIGIPSAQLTREPDSAWHSREDSSNRFGETELDDAETVAVMLIDEVRAELGGS
jgi:hypothetical protein